MFTCNRIARISHSGLWEINLLTSIFIPLDLQNAIIIKRDFIDILLIFQIIDFYVDLYINQTSSKQNIFMQLRSVAALTFNYSSLKIMISIHLDNDLILLIYK